MTETRLKTHLIVTDIYEEYHINWCGRLTDLQPLFKNNKPVFILISGSTRLEINTTNMLYLEECAKKITSPHGRGAISTDTTRIYVKDISGKDVRIGTVTHHRIKTYAPMYDKFGIN